MRKSVIWIPLLLVGAMVYWTLALGFGGLSLMTMTLFQDCESSEPSDSAAGVKDSYQSITVNLSPPASAEAAEQAATTEASPTVPLTVDLIPDHEVGAGPGQAQMQNQVPMQMPRMSDEGGEGSRGGAQRRDPGPGVTAF